MKEIKRTKNREIVDRKGYLEEGLLHRGDIIGDLLLEDQGDLVLPLEEDPGDLLLLLEEDRGDLLLLLGEDPGDLVLLHQDKGGDGRHRPKFLLRPEATRERFESDLGLVPAQDPDCLCLLLKKERKCKQEDLHLLGRTDLLRPFVFMIRKPINIIN